MGRGSAGKAAQPISRFKPPLPWQQQPGDDREAYVDGTGQKIVQVHPATPDCFEFGCAIHFPSDHSMQDLPTHYREDRGLMERLCKHGVGHPDPDHIAFVARTRGQEAASVESVHGCCAELCCSK